ncbi:preprotein translocase subunit YajC [Streptococcus sp.]
MPNASFLIVLAAMVGLMFFTSRNQKKQYQKRMESLNKLQKGNEVITYGGLYATIDEIDTERKTVVLDVDGVYLTFELGAIKTVLPVSEGIAATATEAASSEVDSAIEE